MVDMPARSTTGGPPAGGAGTAEVGERRAEVGLVARRVDHREPLLQLAQRDPALGERLVQLLGSPLAVGI
jgi:hypothetical protein